MRAEKAASFQPGGSFDPVEGFHQRILPFTHPLTICHPIKCDLVASFVTHCRWAACKRLLFRLPAANLFWTCGAAELCGY